MEPVKGGTIHISMEEISETKAEGTNHLGFLVDNLVKEVARPKEKGFEVIYEVRLLNGGRGAYFDTGDVGSVLFELVQYPPGIMTID